jgi:hypothetical protein
MPAEFRLHRSGGARSPAGAQRRGLFEHGAGTVKPDFPRAAPSTAPER